MAFTLPDLPYSHDALAPIMSRETLEYHHDKHHQAYVTNHLPGAREPRPASCLGTSCPASGTAVRLQVLRCRGRAGPRAGAVAAGWTFDVELLARAQTRGLVVREVPVRWTNRPGSRFSPVIDGSRPFATSPRCNTGYAAERREPARPAVTLAP